jgi:hypothetical protein
MLYPLSYGGSSRARGRLRWGVRDEASCYPAISLVPGG